MAITAAAAWALYAATQDNRPAALAAFNAGALQPLLDLVRGGGSQVRIRYRKHLRVCLCLVPLQGAFLPTYAMEGGLLPTESTNL